MSAKRHDQHAGRQAKKQAYRRGHRAESWACAWLRIKGYRILARRLKTSFGEIDIVAKRGTKVAIVEVKARATLAACVEALTPAQQARLIRAANALVAFPGSLAPELNGLATNLRFDLIAIRPYRVPVHVADAWRAT